MLSLTVCSFYLGQPGGHLLGKSCPLGFPLVLFLFYAVSIVCVDLSGALIMCLGQDVEFDCIGS